MCGIVGIFSKSRATSEHLGAHLTHMLTQMSDRGPDSAGVALYRESVTPRTSRLSLYAPNGEVDWSEVRIRLSETLGVEDVAVTDDHALFVVYVEPAEAQRWVTANLPELHLMSAGTSIEIYKAAIPATEFAARFRLERLSGTHALGHTRMATESRVTTAGSHPFSTGMDLCLVHNGSLSNHNRLRRVLAREGIRFQTENDSEVAAGYLMWRLGEGASLEEALEACLDDLDGFYTFAVGTADGFAVLRDPIACKPAVMAETDEWVAMASEYRAIAVLPGAEDAELWEPVPGRVYSWAHAVTA
jgi:methylamine---glutamate N-methyltransferase subunit A